VSVWTCKAVLSAAAIVFGGRGNRRAGLLRVEAGWIASAGPVVTVGVVEHQLAGGISVRMDATPSSLAGIGSGELDVGVNGSGWTSWSGGTKSGIPEESQSHSWSHAIAEVERRLKPHLTEAGICLHSVPQLGQLVVAGKGYSKPHTGSAVRVGVTVGADSHEVYPLYYPSNLALKGARLALSSRRQERCGFSRKFVVAVLTAKPVLLFIAVSTRVQDYLIHSIEIIVDIATTVAIAGQIFNNSVSSLDPLD